MVARRQRPAVVHSKRRSPCSESDTGDVSVSTECTRSDSSQGEKMGVCADGALDVGHPDGRARDELGRGLEALLELVLLLSHSVPVLVPVLCGNVLVEHHPIRILPVVAILQPGVQRDDLAGVEAREVERDVGRDGLAGLSHGGELFGDGQRDFRDSQTFF
ncbi:hypothetical protein DAEQUDRAFT_143119 [Daedalea quercina L-15889]|uniref:Uncharacterized protein n=1 Tax=Daedalea quercina L-15889 TaxID=1314783 RepID=A0A165RW00_9APHY|nr:hypothetical protein DAEQUDRAFT_143119 [Daedalea quercina L-15889]